MNKSSRTYNSIKNIFFSIGNQIITLFLNFFSRFIFIKILGAEYLGINGLFSDILMMLSLADLGLGNAMVYSFYKPLAEKNHKKIGELVNFYKKIYQFIAISVSVIGFSLVPFINIIVKTDKVIPNLTIYYILFLMNSVASYLFVYKSSIINADQKGYIISIYSTIINIIRIIIQIIFLLLTRNYIVYLIIQIVCTLLNNIFIAHKADKIYPFINEEYQLNKEEKRSIFSNIKSVFLYKVSGVLLNGTDNILISTLVGTIWVGYYSNYNMITGTISKFITTAFSSLNASIGSLVVDDDYKNRYSIFKILQMISFWIAGFCFVSIYILIDDFIILWIGEKFVLNQAILLAILFNFYIACVLQPIWSYREATGLFRKIKYIMIITAIVNLMLSVLLGIKWGVAGIITASALAKLTTYFWYEPIILFKEYFNTPSKKYFIHHMFNLIVVMVLAFIIKILCGMMIEVNWLNFIIKVFICCTVPNIVYLFLYSRTVEFKILYKKIKIIIGK